jgi:hypothetical protein
MNENAGAEQLHVVNDAVAAQPQVDEQQHDGEGIQDDNAVDAEPLVEAPVDLPALVQVVDGGVGGGLGFGIGGGLGAAHQALLLRDGPTGFQQYKRPSFFHFKVGSILLDIFPQTGCKK